MFSQQVLKKGFYRNFLSFHVILSTAIALFIFGLCGLLILHAHKLGDMVKQNLEVQVFLHKNLAPQEIKIIAQAIRQKPYLYPPNDSSSLTFISQQEATETFIAETGEDFTQLLGENPLRDAFILKINPMYYQPQKIKAVKKDLEKIGGIYEVSYVGNLVDKIHKNIALISFFLLLFGLFVWLTVSILIDNTIKIALFSQRFLIRSMQLVGATAGFIQKPFLTQALVQGGISGLLASLGLFLFIRYMQSQIEELIRLYEADKVLALMGLLVGLGAGLALLSTYRAVRRYLYRTPDELY
ncbi:MAG: ABC transporter permease [Bacteroidia bacterium]|nr:ABC transporter permease [Bacteroidia bacterium]